VLSKISAKDEVIRTEKSRECKSNQM
jgi:hypothetical protein